MGFPIRNATLGAANSIRNRCEFGPAQSAARPHGRIARSRRFSVHDAVIRRRRRRGGHSGFDLVHTLARPPSQARLGARRRNSNDIRRQSSLRLWSLGAFPRILVTSYHDLRLLVLLLQVTGFPQPPRVDFAPAAFRALTKLIKSAERKCPSSDGGTQFTACMPTDSPLEKESKAQCPSQHQKNSVSPC
jgi:hypothetical protein